MEEMLTFDRLLSLLPDSVKAYLTEPRIRRGVDKMIDLERALEPGLAFDELEDFYAARAASETVRLDWPIATIRLFRATWGGVVARHGLETTLDEDVDTIGPDGLFNGDPLTVVFDGNRKVFLAVRLGTDRTDFGYSVEDDEGNELCNSSKTALRIDGDDDHFDDWYLYSQYVAITDARFDWAAFADARDEAAELIAAALRSVHLRA